MSDKLIADQQHPTVSHQIVCGTSDSTKGLKRSISREGHDVRDGLHELSDASKKSRPNTTNNPPGNTVSLNAKDDSRTESNPDDYATPTKRENLLHKFALHTPSPIPLNLELSKNEAKSLSVAVHLYIEDKYGSTEALHSLRLELQHFVEIISFAGPGSIYNILKNRSALEYLSMWRNTLKSKNVFCGHPETGFESNGFHTSDEVFCPFKHCQSGLFSSHVPLELDLIQLVSKNRQEMSKKSSVRRLFTDDSVERQRHMKSNKVKTKNGDKPKKIDKGNKHVDVFAKGTSRVAAAKNGSFKVPYLMCPVCDFKCTTKEGMKKHVRKLHPDPTGGVKIPKQQCGICGEFKESIDKHVKTVHKNHIPDKICEVCQQAFPPGEYIVHRGECHKCIYPNCPKTFKGKKSRLLDHLKNCKFQQPLDLRSPVKRFESGETSSGTSSNKNLVSSDEEADHSFHNSAEVLDLSRPIGVRDHSIDNAHDTVNSSAESNVSSLSNRDKSDSNELDLVSSDEEADHSFHNSAEVLDLSRPIGVRDHSIDNAHDTVNSSAESNVSSLSNRDKSDSNELDVVAPATFESGDPGDPDTLFKKRSKHPFDKNVDGYQSEFEDTDDAEFTKKRRQKKDSTELQLRNIDKLVDPKEAGDTSIADKFKEYLESIQKRGKKQFNRYGPSDVAKVIKKDLLPVFHKLFSGFDSNWLLDSTTVKNCRFDGKERHTDINLKDPITVTVRVLREAMKKYEDVNSGHQRAKLISAIQKFLSWLEFHYLDNIDHYGERIYKHVQCSHNAVRKFIECTKVWQKCNEDRDEQAQVGKEVKKLTKPNIERDVLLKFYEYLESTERKALIDLILQFANEKSKVPSDQEFAKITNIVMEELMIYSGYRPVVIYNLTRGKYYTKDPGFNPYNTSDDDQVLEEDNVNFKIFRRINPNMPKADLACEHQLASKSAVCEVNCGKQCLPDGFNIYCNWVSY